MTIRETLETELVNYGLWPDQAQAVIKELESEKRSEPMMGRWDEDASAYHSQLLAILMASARNKAVEWIDANKPLHFARYFIVNQVKL